MSRVEGARYAGLAAVGVAALFALSHRQREPDAPATMMSSRSSNAAQVPAGPSLPREERPALRLLVVTNLDGALEPCGCTRDQLGGLDRMAAAIESERDSSIPSLFLSAGDLFTGRDPGPGPELPVQDEWRAETLAQILKQLHLDAAGLGERDVVRGHDRLAIWADHAGFSWLNAGLLLERAQSQNLATSGAMATAMLEPIRASLLRDLGRVRVGVVGMLARPRSGWARGVRGPENPIAATLAEIHKLRSARADLIIALTQAEAPAEAELATPSGADFIVRGVGDRPGASKTGTAWALNGGRAGQGLLIVDLWLKGAGGGFVDADADAGAAHEQNRFRIRYRELSVKSERAKPVRALLDGLAKRVNDYNQHAYANVAPPAVPHGQAGYVGSRPCASCHTAEYLWWTHSPHGRAYASLVARDKQFDLQCASCHVTGYGKPGGSTLTQVGELKDVGCESCHGPGSTHILDARPPYRFVRRDVPKAICLGCHDQEHSSSFDYEKYVPLLTARGHGLPLGQ